MNMLFAGNWRWQIYEEACAQALEKLGVHVIRFQWDGHFRGLPGRVESKYPIPGPASLHLNKELLATATRMRPDVIFIWRGTHIWVRTLRAMKIRTGALMVTYNNDDPFGPKAHGQVPWHHHYYWRLYIKSIPEYDVHFVFRALNIPEILDEGAKEAHVLMPYFIPDLHRPVVPSEADRKRYECDVVFAGHYEPDGRDRYLQALIERGLHVRLFGGEYWNQSLTGDLARYFGKIRPVYGNEYVKALCGARMCLSLHSKMNRDTYTTRSFEIPACGRVMLSERTPDLERMFKEDEEAIYFSSPDELVRKAVWLRDHSDEAERIAKAGMRRVHVDGHSVNDRMKYLLSIVSKHLGDK